MRNTRAIYLPQKIDQNTVIIIKKREKLAPCAAPLPAPTHGYCYLYTALLAPSWALQILLHQKDATLRRNEGCMSFPGQREATCFPVRAALCAGEGEAAGWEMVRANDWPRH